MKLVGKVPVEPLEEERLTNIERNLVVRVSEMSQRPVRAPSRLLAFAGVALAIVVAGVVGWKLRGNGSPVVQQHDEVAITNGALDLGDAKVVSSGGTYKVVRSGARVEVQMTRGQVAFEVTHNPGRLFVVKAGDVEIEDVGTKFSVDYDGTNVEVQVTEGRVKVKRGGKEEEIKAGGAWTIELGPITIATLTEHHAATSPQHPNVVATNEPKNVGVDESHGSDVVPPQVGSGGSGGGSNTPRSGGRKDIIKAIEKHPFAPPVDVGESDPKKAIAKYIENASRAKSGPDHDWNLYSAAVVQHRTKNDTAALYTLSGLLRPDRSGEAYQAALWLQVRVRCLKAFDEDCRKAASLYKDKVPSGSGRGIVDKILAEIGAQ